MLDLKSVFGAFERQRTTFTASPAASNGFSAAAGIQSWWFGALTPERVNLASHVALGVYRTVVFLAALVILYVRAKG